MKRIKRRDKIKIYGDLLSALNEAEPEKIVLSHVQVQINVPFDRLKNYLLDLKELNLIQNENEPRLTEKGRQYLKEYKKVLEFMTRMGLTYQ